MIFEEKLVLALACGPPLRTRMGDAVVHGDRVFKFLALFFGALPRVRTTRKKKVLSI